jgi:hypothetical protein
MVIVDVFQGLVISTSDSLPPNATGIMVSVDDGRGVTYYSSSNNSYTYKTTGGICDVAVAFTDYFGACLWSNSVSRTVKVTIDPALIAEETLGLKHMDVTIQAALENMKHAVTGTVFNDVVNQLTMMGEASGAQWTMTANDIIGIVTELNKDPAECSYTAIAQSINDIQFRASDGSVHSLLNITPNTITIDAKYIHITGDSVFDDNVIVGNALMANSIEASKISSLEGLVIPHADGSYNKFEADGINWYDAAGHKYASVGRRINGVTNSAVRVNFNPAWDRSCSVTLTPTTAPTIAGYSSIDSSFFCSPYNASNTGFNVLAQLTVRSASGSAAVNVPVDPYHFPDWIAPSISPPLTTSLNALLNISGNGVFSINSFYALTGASVWTTGPVIQITAGGGVVAYPIASGLAPGRYNVRLTLNACNSGSYGTSYIAGTSYAGAGVYQVTDNIGFEAIEISTNDYYTLT